VSDNSASKHEFVALSKSTTKAFRSMAATDSPACTNSLAGSIRLTETNRVVGETLP
jgi:hypothetical protein